MLCRICWKRADFSTVEMNRDWNITLQTEKWKRSIYAGDRYQHRCAEVFHYFNRYLYSKYWNLDRVGPTTRLELLCTMRNVAYISAFVYFMYYTHIWPILASFTDVSSCHVQSLFIQSLMHGNFFFFKNYLISIYI